MCYRTSVDAKKDVSTLSSKKEESVFTPREDIDARDTSSLMSTSGVAAMLHKMFTPSGKDKGGISETDDVEMKSTSAVKGEVEKVD